MQKKASFTSAKHFASGALEGKWVKVIFFTSSDRDVLKNRDGGEVEAADESGTVLMQCTSSLLITYI